MAAKSHFVFFKHGPFWPEAGAKTEHKSCYSTSGAILAPILEAVLAKCKAFWPPRAILYFSNMDCFGPYWGQNRTQGLLQYLKGYIGPLFWGLFWLPWHFLILNQGCFGLYWRQNRTQGLFQYLNGYFGLLFLGLFWPA